MQIVRVMGALPEGFEALAADAGAEGVRNMSLLASEWTAGVEQFDGPDDALFAVYADGELAGVGGVTAESGAGEPAMRMRRLYVRPQFRRSGLGRTLAGAMMQQGLEAAHLLTANARATPAARVFWEAMDFVPADMPGFTHWLRR